MSPTTEQIALMAKLVPEHVDFEDGHHWIDGAPDVAGIYPRWWQPWAQTEVGRSDAFLLLAAVCKWASDNWFIGVGVSTEIEGKWRAVYDALKSGDLAAIQHATCEAAEAIGRTLS